MQVDAALAELAAGTDSWRDQAVRHRVARVRSLRKVIAGRAEEVAAEIAAETGKPLFEALAQEVLPVLESCRYWERRFPRWLRRKRGRYLRPGFLRTRHDLVWEPLGTVAVLAPSNFPFSLGMMSAVYMLLAGNTVALKPSERTPGTAALTGDLLTEAGVAPSVMAVITGGPETGRHLASAESVAKVVFFGQARAGRELERLSTERGVPVVLEMGGGTTAIVMDDADLDRAAAGIAWSGFYSSGRSCVGTDRVYAEAGIAELLGERLVREAIAVLAERSVPLVLDDEAIGLVDDAIDRGATRRTIHAGGAGPANDASPGWSPAVLTGVHPDSTILHEELFAPIVAVCHVEDVDEAIRLANEGCPMLGVSLWTSDSRRARFLAGRLNAAMVWVNDSSLGLPSLPWGGRGRAGRGALFGKHSLHEAARLKWISYSPVGGRRPWWPPYSQGKLKAMRIFSRFYR
jgi:acyl-CoA reductase-like NAD-dependent aldehyde dehydrogenase